MRAWDIAIFLLCLNLSIGFIGNIGLFSPDSYAYTETQEAVTSINGYRTGNISDTARLLGTTQYTTADYFSYAMTSFFAAMGILGTVLVNTVFLIPALVNTFHFPLVLAVPIQALVYVVNAFGILQFLSGRSGGLMQ